MNVINSIFNRDKDGHNKKLDENFVKYQSSSKFTFKNAFYVIIYLLNFLVLYCIKFIFSFVVCQDLFLCIFVCNYLAFQKVL